MVGDGSSAGERSRLGRSRWAAIGAAVAVSVGAGGMFAVHAASSAPSSVVTIDPVRILDTRADVGLLGPFASPVSQKLQVTGPVATTTGGATVVPAGSTGVLLNVTVVGPTADGFVSVRPGDASGAPATSSLNFAAGATVPNAVQVALPTSGPTTGQIDVTFDALGVAGPTTEVLIDVVGYLLAVESTSTDEALLARIEALEAGQPFAVSSTGQSSDGLTNVPTAILEVSITAPVDGQVTINYSTLVAHSVVQRDVRCAPFRSTDGSPTLISGLTPGGGIWKRSSEASSGAISGTRLFDIAAGETVAYQLLCHEFDQDGGLVQGRAMTAIFTPAP